MHIVKLLSVKSLSVLSALLFIAMVVQSEALMPSIPELQFTYTERAFRAILEQWQADGIARFKQHFSIDFPFLLCYGLLGYVIATRTAWFRTFPVRTKTVITWLMPSASFADAIENLLHLYLVSTAPPFDASLYLFAGLIASLKWLLIALFVVCAAYALGRKHFPSDNRAP
jgi:hypothetical protein